MRTCPDDTFVTSCISSSLQKVKGHDFGVLPRGIFLVLARVRLT